MPDHYISQSWDEILSPDGTMKANINQPLKIEDRDGKILFQDANPLWPQYEFVSWFPDRTGFIIYSADQACEKCPYDRLVVYQIDKQNNRLNRFVY